MRLLAILALAMLPAITTATGDTTQPATAQTEAKREGGFVWSNDSLRRTETKRLEKQKEEIAALAEKLRSQDPSERDSLQYAIDYHTAISALRQHQPSPYWKREWNAQIGKFDPPTEVGMNEYRAHLIEVQKALEAEKAEAQAAAQESEAAKDQPAKEAQPPAPAPRANNSAPAQQGEQRRIVQRGVTPNSPNARKEEKALWRGGSERRQDEQTNQYIRNGQLGRPANSSSESAPQK